VYRVPRVTPSYRAGMGPTVASAHVDTAPNGALVRPW
jgi:hypothetical protein